MTELATGYCRRFNEQLLPTTHRKTFNILYDLVLKGKIIKHNYVAPLDICVVYNIVPGINVFVYIPFTRLVPGMVVNPAYGQLNKDFFFFFCPRSRLRVFPTRQVRLYGPVSARSFSPIR